MIKLSKQPYCRDFVCNFVVMKKIINNDYFDLISYHGFESKRILRHRLFQESHNCVIILNKCYREEFLDLPRYATVTVLLKRYNNLN